jgi:hypothetical protein
MDGICFIYSPSEDGGVQNYSNTAASSVRCFGALSWIISGVYKFQIRHANEYNA